MHSILVAVLIVGFVYLVAGTKSIWFPSPDSWLRALLLAIPTLPGATVILSLEVWHFVFLAVLAFVKTRSSELGMLFLGLSGLFLVVSLAWYLLLIGVYSLFLRLLWSEVPKNMHWIKPPAKKREILFGWLVSTLAVLIGAAPFLLVAFYSKDMIVVTVQNRMGFTEEQIAAKIFGGWYLTAAYLYQIRHVLRSRRSRGC